MTIPADVLFSDFKIQFEPHPLTGDITRLTNNDAVKQSVKTLVLTEHYERRFRPFLGSNVTHHLFDNAIIDTAEDIRDEIENVLRNFEQRIDLLEVEVNLTPDQNQFIATIIFSVVGSTDPVELEVFLERVR